MKKFYITILFLTLAISSTFAQIEKEHAYSNKGKMFVIQLQNSGSKYCAISENLTDDQSGVKIYNKDHTLYKSIGIKAATYTDTSNYDAWWLTVLNVSELLFDKDNEVEVLFSLYAYNDTDEFNGIYVINENGETIFKNENASAYGPYDEGRKTNPIFKFGESAKMILNTAPGTQDSTSFTVYDLPGTLGSDSNETFINKKKQFNPTKVDIYPNPAEDIFNISSDSKINRIIVSNMNGSVIYNKKLKKSKTRISTEKFSTGIYILRIYTDKGVLQKKVQIQK
jgi:hypothetical protein